MKSNPRPDREQSDTAAMYVGGAIRDSKLAAFCYTLAATQTLVGPYQAIATRQALLDQADGLHPLLLEVLLDRDRRAPKLEGLCQEFELSWCLTVPRTLRDDACEYSWCPGEDYACCVRFNSDEQPYLTVDTIDDLLQRDKKDLLQGLLRQSRLDLLVPFSITP